MGSVSRWLWRDRCSGHRITQQRQRQPPTRQLSPAYRRWMLRVGHHGLQVRRFSPVLHALWRDWSQANAKGYRSAPHGVGPDEEGDGAHQQCISGAGRCYSLLLRKRSPQSISSGHWTAENAIPSCCELRQHYVYTDVSTTIRWTFQPLARLSPYSSHRPSLSSPRWTITSTGTTIPKFIASYIRTSTLLFYEDTTAQWKSAAGSGLRSRTLDRSSSSPTRSCTSTVA